MFYFKLPNNVKVKEIHNAVPITPKSVYSSMLGYLPTFKETYINPILKIESPKPTPIDFTPIPEVVTQSTWSDRFRTPLVIVGSILAVTIFFDYIPFTSDLVRKLSWLSAILNTIEYIPNTIGNWIGSL